MPGAQANPVPAFGSANHERNRPPPTQSVRLGEDPAARLRDHPLEPDAGPPLPQPPTFWNGSR